MSPGLARESHRNLLEDNLTEELTDCSLSSVMLHPLGKYPIHMLSHAYSCELLLRVGLKDPVNEATLSCEH